MNEKTLITVEYFRQYRKSLGFSNQNDVKNFFGAKDISPSIDLEYIYFLNDRLRDIVHRLNNIVSKDIKFDDIDNFTNEYIEKSFEIIKSNNIFSVLNNQGRRPEQVYYSWMRGYVLSNFFLKALSLVFDVDTSKIDLIGDDDLRKIETFKRTPKADLEIFLDKNTKLRIEIQTGFAGINDIKQHKVLEAKKFFYETGFSTIAIHFDLYNGQVAFIKLNNIEDDSVNWITRQQMEGQTVFNIDQNHFIWKITDSPIKYSQILFD